MESKIKIIIECENQSRKRDIANVILFTLKKRDEYQESVIVFNVEKIHPATEHADIIIQTI